MPTKKTKPNAINSITDTSLLSSMSSANQTEPIMRNSETVEDDKKKRRGRKPKDKFAFDDTVLDKPDAITEPDINTVIKIPINCMELDKEFNLTDNITPLPFDKLINDATYNYISGQSQFTEADIGNNISTNIINNNYASTQSAVYLDYYQSKVNDMLTDIIEPVNKKNLTQVEILLEKKYKHTKQLALLSNTCVSQNDNKWLTSTNIACFWDCHCFEHQPWGIPIKFEVQSGKFTVFGIFCSPNCALSYLLANESNTSTLWERVSLLNLLNYKVYENDENIIPAPDKMCLKLFGGPLDINEFRALTVKNNKVFNINFPPCNIVAPVLEETKKIYNQDTYFIPSDKKKQNKIQTELKIKRTRSIYSNKNTLDSLLMSA
jgi:hypothetical protein